MQNELDYAITANTIMPHVEGWPTVAGYRENRDRIREFAQARPNAMLGFIGREWGANTNSGLGLSSTNRRALTLTTSRGGGAVMNSRPVSESSSAVGNYYSGTSVTITAKPYPGYVISHWIVGGNRVNNAQSVTVDINAAQTVELHFANCPAANLRITAVSAARNDWVEIHNPTNRGLSGRGLYLSDSNSNPYKWRLPAVVLQPGETVLIPMRSNDTDETLKHLRANFNLAFRETLRLTHHSGRTLQTVEVTRMRRDQVQRIGRDGTWAVERDTRLPPPEPPTISVPVRLMAQDTISWTRREGAVVQITGNGTYTAALTLPNAEHIASLALMTDGSTFAWPDGFLNVPRAPVNWSNARVEFTSVVINNAPVGINWGNDSNHLVKRGDETSGDGRINLELWSGWWEPYRRLTGVTSIPTTGGDSTSFTLNGGAPITTIVVTFTVTGIPS
jgi:hypothetical protein